MRLVFTTLTAATLMSSAAFAQNVGTAGKVPDFAVTLQQDETMVSKIAGIDVQNDLHEHIGTIRRIAFRGANVKAYVVESGGRLVAVSPLALTFDYSKAKDEWAAKIDATSLQMEAAPAFVPRS